MPSYFYTGNHHSYHHHTGGPLRRWLLTLATICGLLICGSVFARADMIRDAEIEAGLEQLVAPLVSAAGYAPGEITVRVMINPHYNAFVAGKRTIYVHSALLLEAENVLEFLGVMAHEIGHIKAGHVQRIDEAQTAATGAAALATIAAMAIATSGNGDAATGVLLGGSDRANRVFLSSIRRNESVADEIGLGLMDAAGLSSVGLRNLMHRLARQRALPDHRQSVYYSTHPGAIDRLQTLQDHVSRSPHSARPASEEINRLYDRLVAKVFAWTETPQRVLNQEGGPSPDSANRQYATAIAAYRQGDLRTALVTIDRLVAAYPQDGFFHEFRGDILFAMARPADAATAFETALRFRAASPLIQLTLGRALVATGDATQLRRAIEALRAAHRGEPLWAFPARQYAIALGRDGQTSAADIMLAEEAILYGDRQRAVQLARRSLKPDDVDPMLASRAHDIIFRYGGATD